MQPDWFQKNIAHQPAHGHVTVAGARIHYQHWAAPGRPALVLVHGHAAHSHWWDFIAPGFNSEFDIVAIDLSGNGDSDHREQYSAAGFAEEIMAASRHAGQQAPIIMGHSFGGAMARITAYLHQEVSGLLLVDSAIPARRGRRNPPPMPTTRTRLYPSQAEAARRFRLRPPQPRPAQYIVDYIAGHSVKAVDGGWQFKLDPALFARMPPDMDLPTAREMIRALTIPKGFIYGTESRFFNDDAARELDELFDPGRVIPIPDAYHHVFLDQPERFIEAARGLLASLSNSNAPQ